MIRQKPNNYSIKDNNIIIRPLNDGKESDSNVVVIILNVFKKKKNDKTNKK